MNHAKYYLTLLPVLALLIFAGITVYWFDPDYFSKVVSTFLQNSKVYWWGYVPALVPALLVALQGFYLITFRAQSIDKELNRPPEVAPSNKRRDLDPARKQYKQQHAIFFDAWTIFELYAIYAISLAIISVTLFQVCCTPIPASISGFLDSVGNSQIMPKGSHQDQPKPDEKPVKPPKGGGNGSASAADRIAKFPPRNDYLEAFRLGAMGAFIYALISLGLRTYQRDITGPAAVWVSVQLVLGPMLAGTCAYFVLPNSQVADESLSFSAIFFFAGLAPRTIIDWIDANVRRVYLQETVAAQSRRVLPLATLRGLTATIEGRLAEEGITSVEALANANPVRLLRNTPFDPRQVLGWMDEGLLIKVLPDHWEKLEKLGITGAIDLAWYGIDDTSQVVSEQAAIPQAIITLAGEIGLDAQILWDITLRLASDDQLELIWAMHESNG